MIHPCRSRLLAGAAAALLILLPTVTGAGQEILLNFSGLLKYVDRREIVIEPDPENQMTFVRSKRTQFVIDGKKVKPDKIPAGTAVTVECFQRLNGEMEAVTVTAVADHSPSK
jgi:hypothetical protein